MFSSGRITEQTFLTLQSHFSGGATGALIPYVERAYGISYATVSLLFVFTFIGYVIAALGAGTLSRKVGFGHALCISVVVELFYIFGSAQTKRTVVDLVIKSKRTVQIFLKT